MDAPSSQAGSCRAAKSHKEDGPSPAPSAEGTGSFCIAPRNRAKEGAKKSNAPVQFTPEMIRALASKPIKQAAQAVGVSVTALKRACRQLGFEKWPRECVEVNISYDAIKRETISRTSSSSPKSSPPTDNSPSPAPEASHRRDGAKPLPVPVKTELLCCGSQAQAPLPPMQTPSSMGLPEASEVFNVKSSCCSTKAPVLPPMETSAAHMPCPEPVEELKIPSIPAIMEIPSDEQPPSCGIPPMEVPSDEKLSCCSVPRAEVPACGGSMGVPQAAAPVPCCAPSEVAACCVLPVAQCLSSCAFTMRCPVLRSAMSSQAAGRASPRYDETADPPGEIRPLRNQFQAPAISLHFVPGMRVCVFV